jgi:17beta-estradiol 17-dehydrogenase / very-long-chain 3-oxoacyl-CoA reductase
MPKAALARAGHGSKIVAGYWAHALQQLGGEVLGWLPAGFRDSVYMDIMRQERAALDGVAKSMKQS